MPNKSQDNPKSWTIFNRFPQYRQIIESLTNIPPEWSLTPIHGKNPYRKNWQSEETIARSKIAHILEYGEELISKKTDKPYTAYASGYGLRTGNGLLAIDIDGHSARKILEKMLGTEIPQTVSWTSGKPGRSQLLFRIQKSEVRSQKGFLKDIRSIQKTSDGIGSTDNEDKKQILTSDFSFLTSFTRYVVTEYQGIKADSGEALEFRYERCSSALPPSYHPETGAYRWLNSPKDIEIAIAPPRVMHILSVLAQEEQQKKEAKTKRLAEIKQRRLERAKQEIEGKINFVDILEQSCDRLDTDIYDWEGHNFYETAHSLQGCCPNHDSQSRRSFHVNKENLTWFCFGCNVGGGAVQYREFVATGNTKVEGKRFVEIVEELADQANIVIPEKQKALPRAETEPSNVKNNFLTWLNAIAHGLSKRAYKGFGQNCLDINRKEVLNSSNKIYYSPGAPIDWEYCRENNIKIVYQNRDRAKLWAEIRGSRYEVVGSRYSLFDLIFKSIKFQSEPNLLLTTYYLLLKESKAFFVLDTSATGTGKSHISGLFKSEKGKTWVLSQDHRNPTTATLEQNKIDIPTRNMGIKHDSTRVTPGNQPYRHNVKPGEIPDEPSNCQNAYLFHLLASKGYNFDGGDNKICGGCIYQQWKIEDENGNKISKCAGSVGVGHGYKHLRSKALAYPELRGHIDSLPGIEDYDYSNDIAIIDEASTLIRHSKTLTARLVDLDKWLLDIAEFDRELFDQLYPYLSRLRKLLDPKNEFTGKERKYGLDHDQVLKALGKIPVGLDEAIEKITQLTTVSPVIVPPDKISGLPKEYSTLVKIANSEFRKIAKEKTEANLQAAACNFVLPLLKTLNDSIMGTIRIAPNHTFNLTVADSTHKEKLQEFNKVILLDATGDKAHLEQVLGQKILHIEQYKKPLSNLKVTQVNITGLGSGNWSEQAQQRVAALTKHLEAQHPNLEVISLKHYSEDNGYWFKDNRGTNRYKGVEAIAAFGKPLINLGVVKDQYRVLYGNLDNFQAYYDSLMEKEILQLIGRQRAHLYPDKHFNLYICASNLKLDFLASLGVKIAQCEAFELCPEAGTKEQFRRSQLISIVSNLIDLGEPISQKRIAQMMNVTQGYISQLCNAITGGWQSIKKLLPLYIGTYRDTNIFETQPIKDWILDNLGDYLKEWLELIDKEGMQSFCNKVLQPQPLQIRGFIIAVLYSIVLNKDDIANLSIPPPT